MVINGTSYKSSFNASGALGALAKQDTENCTTIIKRVIMLVGIKGTPQRAVRLLHMVAAVCDNESMCQLAMSKMEGIPPLIPWLENPGDEVQVHAARAVYAVASNNKTTQTLIGQLGGVRSLIVLVQQGSLQAKENACSALWHLATLEENRTQIEQKGGAAPIVRMLVADGEQAPQLAAMTLLRLAEGRKQMAYTIAQAGGVKPLVKLLTSGNAETQQVAAAALAALATVSLNRDRIVNAGAIAPLMKLVTSRTLGTPETAARALGWIARNDTVDDIDLGPPPPEPAMDKGRPDTEQSTSAESMDGAGVVNPQNSLLKGSTSSNEADNAENESVRGGEQRRMDIKDAGGIGQLISMLDGANLFGKGALEPNPLGGGWAALRVGVEDCEECTAIFPGSLVDFGMRIGMQEQAASTLSHLADGDLAMQVCSLRDRMCTSHMLALSS